MSLRLRNINSLNVKQENEIMAKAVAGVKNINISKPTIKVKNITFERKTTVIAGKSLKENVVQRTALGELSNKILSRDEDSTSTTSIVKKEVVKTRSLAVATIHNTRRKCDVSSHKNSMCTNALCQYGPYTTGFHSELKTKPKCNKRKLSSRRTQENVKLKKSETILNVKNEKVEKANKAIKDVNKIVPISRFLNKVENREVVKPEPKSYSSQCLEANLRDIDKLSGDCQILLGYYAEDIYSYLRDLEIKFPISPTFMSELLINSKMRSILVDWLVEVHQQFALLPETLYVTVSILDRFLQIEKTVQRKYLQLVGISALFVACKYEEICSPDVQDFVYISDSAYSKEQIFKMEQHMLMKLEFKLGRPVPLHFLRRFSRAADASSEQHAVAKYLMELCLVECDMCHYAPSMIAAAALYLSLSIINNPCMEPVWTKNIQHYSRYNVGEVEPVAKKLAAVVKKLDNSKLMAVKKKYSHSKYAKVSLRPELDSQALKSIAESRMENVVL